MWSMLLYFFLALLLLVSVHEYGHFLVARCCGVKVLRFSFGFGKILGRWHDKRGTEYTWSLIPLGGYVKMLDETETPVPKEQRHMAFNNQPIWARIAIVLAGPLFNFIFAFVAIWLMLVIGIQSFAPVIDRVIPNSIAARSGLSDKQEILSFNGHNVAGWRDVVYAMTLTSGTQNAVVMTVKPVTGGQATTHVLSLTTYALDEKKPDVLASLGLVPFVPIIPPIVGEVMPDSPAQSANLHVGDVIVSLDGHSIDRWSMLVDWVRIHPEEDMSLQINRDGHLVNMTLHTGRVMNEGHSDGYLGVRSQDPLPFIAPWLRLKRETPLSALNSALKQTVDLTGSTVLLVSRLVMGKLPLDSISGPIGIAQGAGESARRGFSDYLYFLALISVSLGVLNLLPIPLLDGGHLLYYLLEIIIRRPVSEAVKAVGAYVGMGVLGMLMMVAMHNDMTRLAG